MFVQKSKLTRKKRVASFLFYLLAICTCDRSWPTIPQVFVKGNFVGGCDIMMDMHKSGELDTLLIREKIIEPKMDERNQHHHVTESSKPPVVAGGNDEPTENSQSKRKD